MRRPRFLGRRIAHLLAKRRAEQYQFGFEKADIPAHHAEMGNLLSLHPKINGLRADAEEDRCLSNGQRDLFGKRERDFPNCVGRVEGEAFDIHTCLYELLCFYANKRESINFFVIISRCGELSALRPFPHGLDYLRLRMLPPRSCSPLSRMLLGFERSNFRSELNPRIKRSDTAHSSDSVRLCVQCLGNNSGRNGKSRPEPYCRWHKPCP